MRSAFAQQAICSLGFALACASPLVAQNSPFAATVLDYDPAPGQFVNDPLFNNPALALGSPIGGGTINPDNTSIVTLGGFGGSITLAFDHTVIDHAANPLGLDAIVFSNAVFIAANPNRRFAECATIEISLDVNQNAIADDPWFLIPGSHITDPIGQFTQVTWDDDTSDQTNPPSNPSWIPPGHTGVWTTQGYLLPDDPFTLSTVLENPNGPGATTEGVFGYADHSPTLILGDFDSDNIVDDPTATPEKFYTTPDDPFIVGISPKSGGGDAFDIAWAIDPITSLPANLPGFDFIRITTALDHIHPVLGEVSSEIDAVADIDPPRQTIDDIFDDITETLSSSSEGATGPQNPDSNDILDPLRKFINQKLNPPPHASNEP